MPSLHKERFWPRFAGKVSSLPMWGSEPAAHPFHGTGLGEITVTDGRSLVSHGWGQKHCPRMNSEDPAQGRSLSVAPQTAPVPPGWRPRSPTWDGDPSSHSENPPGIRTRLKLMMGRIVLQINKHDLFPKQMQPEKGKVRTIGNTLCSFLLTTAVLFQLLLRILCRVLVSTLCSPLPKR